MERDLHRRQERDKRKAGYKKPAIPYFVRRILLSWLIFLIIGGLIGGAIGHAATKKVQAGEGQPPAGINLFRLECKEEILFLICWKFISINLFRLECKDI